MAQRSHESPMDFEWQNHGGPIDENSPFHKFAVDERRRLEMRNQQLLQGSIAKKRPHSVFDSFSKAQTPSLPLPTTQTYLISHSSPTTKPLPALPPNLNPAFTTPRKLDFDFSSEPEGQSSPENNADSEATPDMGLKDIVTKTNGAMTRFVGNEDKTKTKDKKGTLFGRLAASSGKGEIPRINHATAIEKRVRKKRSQRQLTRRRADSLSESEDGRSSPKKQKGQDSNPQPQVAGLIPSVLAFIHNHPSLPHILSFYAQLLLNVFLVLFFIYIIYSFWSTIRNDVNKASDHAIAEALAELAICTQNYRENRCDKEHRVPAMEAVCQNWEKCMNKDPNSVGRARVSAHTFAEIFNSFIEPISYKAMVFSLILVFGCVAISNFAFGFFRNKDHPYSAAFMQAPPSTTPHRYPSGGRGGFYTPYGQNYGLEPQPSAHALGMGSPTKRLQYDRFT